MSDDPRAEIRDRPPHLRVTTPDITGRSVNVNHRLAAERIKAGLSPADDDLPMAQAERNKAEADKRRKR